MTVEKVKIILINKIAVLDGQLQNAEATGNLELVVQLEAEKNETQITIDSLDK
jgi:hypothetical protein